SFHLPLFQPSFAGIKQFKSCFLIVNAFKKTHAARWLVECVSSFAVDKGRYPTDSLLSVIYKYPSCAFPMLKVFILDRIKYLFNIFIQRPYPIFLLTIKPYGQL